MHTELGCRAWSAGLGGTTTSMTLDPTALCIGVMTLRFAKVDRSKSWRDLRPTTINCITVVSRQLWLFSRKYAVIAKNRNCNATTSIHAGDGGREGLEAGHSPGGCNRCQRAVRAGQPSQPCRGQHGACLLPLCHPHVPVLHHLFLQARLISRPVLSHSFELPPGCCYPHVLVLHHLFLQARPF